MTRPIFAIAFALGAIAVGLMARNFFPGDTLAFVVTLVIALVYLIGGAELLQFREATDTLNRALNGLNREAAESMSVLDEWLIKLHPSLHHSVRQRVEGERTALPAPVLTPYLTALLVMLGLLGTFIGLVETLKGVVFALEGSSELEAIRQALTAPMGGLELAFGTSVAGVAASAMLGLMSALSRRDRVFVTRELDKRIASDLRHFSLTYQRRETFKALQQQAASFPDIADKLQAVAEHMQNMGSQMHTELLAGQEQFHQAMQTHYRELAAHLESALRDSVAKTDQVISESGKLIGEGIQPIMQASLSQMSSDMVRHTESTHKQLSQVVESQLHELIEHFSATSSEVAENWQQGLDQQQQNNQLLLDKVQSAFATFRDEFGHTSQVLIDGFDTSTRNRAEQQQQADEQRLAQWLETLQQNQTHGSEQINALAQTLVEKMASTAETQQASIKDQADTLTNGHTHLLSELETSSQQLYTQQRELTQQLQDVSQNQLSAQTTHAQQTLGELNTLLQASEALVQARSNNEKALLEAQQQSVADIAEVLRKELGTLRDQEAQRGNAANQRLAELEATVANHLATLGQALEAPMTRLIETASETPKAAAEVIGKLRQEVTNNIERDNQLLEERSRLMEELDSLSNSLTESSTAQANAIEKLVDASGERLNKIGDQFNQQIDSKVAAVGEVVDQFAVSAVEMASLGEAFGVAMELYKASNEKLAESLNAIETSLEQTADRSDEQLGYYIAQAKELIDYSVLTQKEIFEQMRQLKPSEQNELPFEQ